MFKGTVLDLQELLTELPNDYYIAINIGNTIFIVDNYEIIGGKLVLGSNMVK